MKIRQLCAIGAVAMLGLSACGSDVEKVDAEQFDLNTTAVDGKMSEAELVERMWNKMLESTKYYSTEETVDEGIAYLEENKDAFLSETSCVVKNAYDDLSAEAMEILVSTDFANEQKLAEEDLQVLADANEKCYESGGAVEEPATEEEATEEAEPTAEEEANEPATDEESATEDAE